MVENFAENFVSAFVSAVVGAAVVGAAVVGGFETRRQFHQSAALDPATSQELSAADALKTAGVSAVADFGVGEEAHVAELVCADGAAAIGPAFNEQRGAHLSVADA